MRLIDADALPTDDFLNNTKMVLQDDIDNAPTIDAVPVVRCRDCQNWEHLLADDGYCYCPFVDHYTSGDWFCADGERKEYE